MFSLEATASLVVSSTDFAILGVSLLVVLLSFVSFEASAAAVVDSDGFSELAAVVAVVVVVFAACAGSGPFAELRLVNSFDPCAKRHLSPYLQVPFSLQFLHISYLRRRTTGYDDVDEVLSESPPDCWAF